MAGVVWRFSGAVFGVAGVWVPTIGVLFGWFAKKRGRFLVYLVAQSSTRAIYFPKRTPMGQRGPSGNHFEGPLLDFPYISTFFGRF